MAQKPESEAERESRAILKRLAEEDTSGMMARTGRHLAAADAEGVDKVELWGMRIGRGIGALITVGLVLVFLYWLLA